MRSPEPPLTVKRELRRRLLKWYSRARRALPWRATRDPYRIWVSEVMLQQTQVATATPYYTRFVARFPTVRTLARARLADVLAAWAGLGYYRRARLLHAAARVVVRDHSGRVPDQPRSLAALPGIGRYTAGAVLSIAFDRPAAVLDGNVARVLARWFAVPLAPRDPRGSRALWALAEAMITMRRPGEWNQALMELGATVCVPRSPRCGECPVSALCRARALGRPEAFPPPVRRSSPVRMRRAVARIERHGRTLLERRDGPLLAGLWEPPGVELEDGAEAGPLLARRLAAFGLRARLEDTGERVCHTITHRRIEVEVWSAVARGAVPRSARLRWIRPGRRDVPLTALARRVLRAR